MYWRVIGVQFFKQPWANWRVPDETACDWRRSHQVHIVPMGMFLKWWRVIGVHHFMTPLGPCCLWGVQNKAACDWRSSCLAKPLPCKGGALQLQGRARLVVCKSDSINDVLVETSFVQPIAWHYLQLGVCDNAMHSKRY